MFASLFDTAFGAVTGGAGGAMSAPPATSGSDQQVKNETHVDASTGDFMVTGAGGKITSATEASSMIGQFMPIIAIVAAVAIAVSVLKK